MTWMLTATGAQIDLRFHAHADIRIEDIAHHLAQINRYTGACRRPYSVAEHSLLVMDILRWVPNLALSPTVLLAALLHDAHEAYTSDLSSPMKQVLGAGWQAAERHAHESVLAHFEVLDEYRALRPAIHRADLTALITERVHLMPAGGPPWPAAADHPPVTWVDWEGRERLPWTHWRNQFLERFHELDRVRRAATTTQEP